MMKQTAMASTLFVVILLGSSCAEKQPTTPPTANSLIGLTRADLVLQFGEPDNANQTRPGVEGMLWADGNMRLNAFVQDGKVVTVVVPMSSSLKLGSGIGYGSSMYEVTRAYGEVTSIQEVQGDMSAVDYAAGTLYHDKKASTFRLRYTEPSLLFIFDAIEQVKVFSIGEDM